MRKFIRLIKEKWLRQTGLTIFLVAIIFAIFLLTNKILDNLNLAPIDFTQEKLYSLTDDSKDVIKNVEVNVEMYFFGYSEDSTQVILGNQYHDVNDKINVHIIDVEERPDLASQYNVSSVDRIIAVSSNQRYKVIDSSELYTYDSTTYETIDITEQKLTNAILDVTIAKKPQVYFLAGHEEYGINSESYLYTLAQQITNEVNDVNTLDLLSSDMPETCDVLVIANPIKDFTDLETEKIENYINNGGKIVWMQNPYLTENVNVESLVNVNKILSLYGISFSKGIVCEQSSSNMLMSSPELIIPELTYNSIVKDIYTDGSIVMIDAGKINTADAETLESLNVSASPFIKSTSDSYYKEEGNAFVKNDTDESGPFVLGEVLTKKINDETTSTLVAISNNFFVTNLTFVIGQSYAVPINLRNNKDILLNTIAYLSNREDSIRIRKDVGVIAYTATELQDQIVKVIIFGVPILIIVAGIVIAIVRRRKK